MSASRLQSIPFWQRVLVVGFVLSIALGWMVYQRVLLLHNGREIVLQTLPVDPRSLFRGHYARLNYSISRLERQKISGGAQKWRRHDRVFVSLEKSPDGFWTPVSIARTYGTPKPREVVLAGRVASQWNKYISVRYGIEKYFAAKKDAIALERIDRRKTPVGVILRVSSKGEAAISGLMVGGKKIYDEPLF